MKSLGVILSISISLLVIAFITASHNKETKAYCEQIDSLQRVIIDKESDIVILLHDAEIREMEISWLGHSLDSLKYNIKP